MNPLKYTKAITAAIMAVLVILNTFGVIAELPPDLEAKINTALVTLGTILVYALPNKGA